VLVTGMGTINSLGLGVSEFWDSLDKGASGITLSSTSQLDGYTVVGSSAAVDWTRIPERFQKMDRALSASLMAAEEAVEDSKVDRDSLRKAGVVVGTSLGPIDTLRETHRHLNQSQLLSTPDVCNAVLDNIGRSVAQYFESEGPNATLTTACAASSNALSYAHSLVASGVCETVLCGGVDVISPITIAGFHALRTLSSDYCRPFSRTRRGISLGEGAAFLVLESEESAIARGRHHYAVFSGYGLGNEAYHSTKPDPSGKVAARVMRSALLMAGMELEDVKYINAHGTGTLFNDAMETKAIKEVFGASSYGISVSSTKSMHGHTLGAAGAIEAVASILSLVHQTVPPTLGFQERDPECDLDYCFEGSVKRDVPAAMSNSFAFGGHIVSLIFERGVIWG